MSLFRKNVLGSPLILLHFDGPKKLTDHYRFGSRVEPTRLYLDAKRDLSLLDNTVADHLYSLQRFSPQFFHKMSMLDPPGAGDCGFHVLHYFAKYADIQGKFESVLDLRYFLRRVLKQDRKYFASSEIALEMYRPPGADEETWQSYREMLQETVRNDVEDPSSPDSLYNLLEEGPDGVRPMMDNRHLEVFAKATSTRFFVLNFHTSCESSNPFTCVEIDWRGSAPIFHFTEGLPVIDDSFDFYRTAVVMNAPCCSDVDGDTILWNKNNEQRHFTMWVPEKYAELVSKTAAEVLEDNRGPR